MPYRITRHSDDLLWVVLEGHLALDQAEAYFYELWALLDTCPIPTDLLVDGRRIAGASPAARRRTEQVAHHPRLGHLAFVVSEHHLLIFAPLVKLVSGVGLFGTELDALDYLRTARGLPSVLDTMMPRLPPLPAEPHAVEPQHGLPSMETPPSVPHPAALWQAHEPQRAHEPQPTSSYSPSSGSRRAARPAPNFFGGLTDIVDGWTNNIRNLTRQIDGD